MTDPATVPAFEGWALLEMMGHRQRVDGDDPGDHQ